MAEVVTGLDRQVTVEVDIRRYEQLIQAEQKLSMLETALSKKDSYSNIDDIKEIFNIQKGN
jgi:hypothetical protein